MTAASPGPASAPPRPDWRLVVGFAALTILIHFLTNGAYGYFRDELYFIGCGRHLAWGYVDLPPMVALVARLSHAAMGDSLFAIRFFPAIRYALPAVIVIVGVMIAPVTIPVLPVETFIRYQRLLGMNVRFETRKTAELPQTYADMFGWPEMAATVAKVYNSIPPNERAKTAIFTRNYSEAAAIDFFGPRYGLPQAISGHMSYYLWGPRGWDGKVAITIGVSETDLKRIFGSVDQAATLDTTYSMPDEQKPIYICRNPKLPIQQLWPLTKVYR